MIQDLISKSEFLQATQLQKWHLGGVAGPLMRLTGLQRLNKMYHEIGGLDGEKFLEAFIKQLEVDIEWHGKGLERIPKTGAFITVSNHPFGGLDGILLLHLLSKRRPDFKVMANYLLQQVEPLRSMFISVDPFEKRGQQSPNSINLDGLKQTLLHLKEGKPLGIFPAGEVSTFQSKKRRVTDKTWNKSAIKLIRKAGVPVIPIYFEGSNSLWFHLMGMIHPALRTVAIPAETLKKKRKTLKVYVGSAIREKEIKSIAGTDRLGRYLRARTYSLGTPLKVKAFFRPTFHFPSNNHAIDPPISSSLIRKEIEALDPNQLLCSQQQFDVYLAEARQIPNTLHEIGRLREVMFREVGEGTGLALDTDEYDLYYRHLFLWDRKAGKVAGAYRMGLGNEIIELYGKKGFYIHSLFKIKDDFEPWMRKGVELGRSFVRQSYQKQRLPLFLLWKGIYTFLQKHPNYQYLLGPVSISNSYSQLSRDLIVGLIRHYYFDHELAKFVKPRKRFQPKIKHVEVESLVEGTAGNLKIADKILAEVEPHHMRLPILLKKYIKQNARIIGFNVDPKFSHSLDGLIVLDLVEVPQETMENME